MALCYPTKCCFKYSLRKGIFFLIAIRSMFWILLLVLHIVNSKYIMKHPINSRNEAPEDPFEEFHEGVTYYSEVFTLSLFTFGFATELLLAIGVAAKIRCPILLWLIFAGVIFLALVGFLATDPGSWMIDLPLIILHVYTFFMVFGLFMTCKSSAGEVLAPPPNVAIPREHLQYQPAATTTYEEPRMPVNATRQEPYNPTMVEEGRAGPDLPPSYSDVVADAKNPEPSAPPF